MSIEVVNNFNNELRMLFETKLPVSRQRMYQITKAAMKASKYYKHVVQSVEKIIIKCPDEYKLPGLYVVDSIVRHSRHQHGEKDMFGPRFTKNLVNLFRDVLKCQQTDASLVVRLLNLWQKNAVFDSKLIQALLDVAANPQNEENLQIASDIATRIASEYINKRTSLQRVASKDTPSNETVRQMNHLGHSSDIPYPYDDSAENNDLSMKHAMYLSNSENISRDYSSDSPLKNQAIDDPHNVDIGQALIGSVSELLRNFQSGALDSDTQIIQLQLLQEKIVEHSDMLANGQIIDPEILGQLHLLMSELTNRASSIDEGNLLSVNDGEETMQQPDFEAFQSVNLENKLEHKPTLENGDDCQAMRPAESLEEGELDPDLHASLSNDLPSTEDQVVSSLSNDHSHQTTIMNDIAPDLKKKRKKSRSSSRSPRKKRSRSRERKKERTKDSRKERRKKGYPPIREGCVCLLSRTIFIGHLAKQTTEKKLRSVLEEYGPIEFFNLIPPRGCAFVTFEQRKSAAKSIDKMEGMRLDYKEIKVTWGTNKGVKNSEFSSLWDLTTGCTYIPEEQMPLEKSARTALLDGGGELDLDSLSSKARTKLERLIVDEKAEEEKKVSMLLNTNSESDPPFPVVNIAQLPPPPPPAGAPNPFMPMSIPPPPPPQPGLMPPCIPLPSMPIPMPHLYASQVPPPPIADTRPFAPFAPPPPPPPSINSPSLPPQPPSTPSSNLISQTDSNEALSALSQNHNEDVNAAATQDVMDSEDNDDTFIHSADNFNRIFDGDIPVDPTTLQSTTFRPVSHFRTTCPPNFNQMSSRMRQPFAHPPRPNHFSGQPDFRPPFGMRQGLRPVRPGFMPPRWGPHRPPRPRPF